MKKILSDFAHIHTVVRERQTIKQWRQYVCHRPASKPVQPNAAHRNIWWRLKTLLFTSGRRQKYVLLDFSIFFCLVRKRCPEREKNWSHSTQKWVSQTERHWIINSSFMGHNFPNEYSTGWQYMFQLLLETNAYYYSDEKFRIRWLQFIPYCLSICPQLVETIKLR